VRCSDREGRGYLVDEEAHCAVCGGNGRRSREETLAVSVPAGSRNGMSIRYRGHGDLGVSGQLAGDLYVTLVVAPHPLLSGTVWISQPY